MRVNVKPGKGINLNPPGRQRVDLRTGEVSMTNHRVDNRLRESRATLSRPTRGLSGNSPYATPRQDYSRIREAKLKCEDCQGSNLGACNRDALTCQSFTLLERKGVAEFAYDRVGSSMEGGFAH